MHCVQEVDGDKCRVTICVPPQCSAVCVYDSPVRARLLTPATGAPVVVECALRCKTVAAIHDIRSPANTRPTCTIRDSPQNVTATHSYYTDYSIQHQTRGTPDQTPLHPTATRVLATPPPHSPTAHDHNSETNAKGESPENSLRACTATATRQTRHNQTTTTTNEKDGLRTAGARSSLRPAPA